MTLDEYNLLIKAEKLRQVDIDYRIHQLAYVTFVAKAKKKRGKKEVPVFDNFKKFYDYEKEVKKALKEESEPINKLDEFAERFLK